MGFCYQFFAFLSIDTQINLDAGRTCAGLAFPIIEESQEDGVVASNEQHCGKKSVAHMKNIDFGV